MKPDRPPFSPGEYLDRRKQALTHKHQRRLQRMTREAMLSRAKPWHSSWVKPALATAFSVMLVTTFVLLKEGTENVPNPVLQDADLPAWVTDTEVPLTLIENLEFYDWLAQQPENQQAKLQTSLTVAINTYYQYRFSQRLTTRDPAQRVSGAASYPGAVQR